MLKPQKSQPTNKKSFQAITKIFKWSHLNLSWFPFPKIIEDCKTLWSKYKLTKKNLWEIPNYPSNPSFYGKIRNFFLFRSFADLQGKRKLFIGLKKALILNKFAIWRKDQTVSIIFRDIIFLFVVYIWMLVDELWNFNENFVWSVTNGHIQVQSNAPIWWKLKNF